MSNYTYEYPRPSVTVDCIIFGYDSEKEDLQVLLIERGDDPFQGSWALPGGFVEINESTSEAARRELEEETGVKDVFLEQLYTFSEPGRDPRGRVISVAYYSLVSLSDYAEVEAGDDAAKAEWFSINELPDLAFDHDRILDMAISRLRGKIPYAPVGFELLSSTFTLPELQKLHETILGRDLDKTHFRRKIAKLGIVEDTGEKEQNVNHRPASLYKINEKTYHQLLKNGYPFEF